MTCIAAVEDGDRVWMCSDTGITINDSKDNGAEKMWLHSPGIAFGIAGDIRGCQLVRYRLRVPRRSPGVSATDWCVTRLVPAIKRALKGERSKLDIDMLVALDGAVYQIAGDYSVARSPRRYATIGSGCGEAFGALYATAGRPPKERVELAVRAACEGNSSCFLPLNSVCVGPYKRAPRVA